MFRRSGPMTTVLLFDAPLAVRQAPRAGLAALPPARGRAGRARDGCSWHSCQPTLWKATEPYWAVAAHLLADLGRTDQARVAYARAISLCEDPAVRDFPQRQVQLSVKCLRNLGRPVRRHESPNR